MIRNCICFPCYYPPDFSIRISPLFEKHAVLVFEYARWELVGWVDGWWYEAHTL